MSDGDEHDQSPFFSTAALVSLVLAAAGCSTKPVADLQQHALREIYRTNKPTEVVVRCFVANLGCLGTPNTDSRSVFCMAGPLPL